MRSIILYAAISLDHFIAREDGDIAWLEADEYRIPGNDYGYGEFYQQIDTTLMGHKTYRQIEGFDLPFPYPDKTNYVFSRSSRKQHAEFVRFVAEDPPAFVRQLKQEEGKDIWLVGGCQINSLLMARQLIDQIVLTVFPLTLGRGIPLFDLAIACESRFNLLSHQAFDNGIMQLQYAKSS